MRLSLCGSVAHFRAAGLAKKCSERCMVDVAELAKKCSVALLANRGGLCRRKARLILAKAGEFKAQLVGGVAHRQRLQPHRARNEKS